MKRRDLFVIFLIAFSILVVFFDLFTLKESFLSGDHREQQYPWAKFYQERIQEGGLPWWTTHNQCGFPILAEGQVGAFYPLNYLFFRNLPVKMAYNYEILFHYFLGALLFYFYLRRRNVSEWGSFFATLIYLYGSAQGGYFYYNLISQKTVIWLPLSLLLIDLLIESKSFAPAFFLSLVFSVQLFAGYLQVAIYSIAFSSFYFVLFWLSERRAKVLFYFGLAGSLAVFFSLVQLLPTYELALFSSRAGAAKELAYVGSMKPVGFLTLFYPAWDGLLGSEFYVGLLGFFFVLVSLFSPKETSERFFAICAALFLLLALGKYSPLYRILVESTGFGGFRTPIKFLFFVTFSCAALAGFGFDKFFAKAEIGVHSRFKKKSGLLFLLFAVPATLIPFFGQFILGFFRDRLLPFFQEYVVKHFYGKAGHPHSAEYYYEKAGDFYQGVIQNIGFSDPNTLTEWILILSAILFVSWLVRTRMKRRLMELACFVFLFVDLFLYGFTSIKPNYEPYDTIDYPVEYSTILELLKRDPLLYRVMEVYRDPSENRKFPVFPNFNMLYKIDDIGLYTPLAMREYKDFLRGWGYVNDSISFQWVSPGKVEEKLPELGLLNVKYVLSEYPFACPGLRFITEEKGVRLYANTQNVSRAFFLPGASELKSFGDVKDCRSVWIEKYGQDKVTIEYEAPSDGLLVLTDIFYPNWRVSVNGEERKILRAAKLFRSVPIKQGRNKIIFAYDPEKFVRLGVIALGLALVILICVVVKPYVVPEKKKGPVRL